MGGDTHTHNGFSARGQGDTKPGGRTADTGSDRLTDRPWVDMVFYSDQFNLNGLFPLPFSQNQTENPMLNLPGRLGPVQQWVFVLELILGYWPWTILVGSHEMSRFAAAGENLALGERGN